MKSHNYNPFYISGLFLALVGLVFSFIAIIKDDITPFVALPPVVLVVALIFLLSRKQ